MALTNAMCRTRPIARPAKAASLATMKEVVIIAHGSPSEPAPQEAFLQRLAQQVAALCPGDTIRGATLAAPGSLERALAGLHAPILYPLFMAEGWFTRRELPRRIAELGVTARQLRPLGRDPALPGIIAQICTDAAHGAGIDPASGDLILVAHGSKVARRSKDSAYDMAQNLRRLTRFWRVRVALIEEPPFLCDIAAQSERGLVLPFFALHAGHVEGDIPEALRHAQFAGPLLPAVGAHPIIPELIARAVADA